ncbi:hypothetical protein [Pseudomonas phage vB_PaeM_PS119XW]|uniref:Uncharacterized protein n=1 Tax=Pseudomonas phage vB_PaeM_PS119XW TaxID=2601632 RepID=A0A5C1K8A2_9CAUD|nr:hypothetical protein PP933_gp300 [Pseudomonas phage vB_PaeM_PS119XW]QEM42029.1 hypothetical protein [Pseudomonas phage vB_PaeM_PS119XW]BEG72544.1 hypothetical protein RVBP21_1720 [Pseudomonas phage BRkr]
MDITFKTFESLHNKLDIYSKEVKEMKRYIIAFLIMMFTGCQPSFAERDQQITEKSCKIAVSMSRDVIKIFRNGGDQFQAMSYLNKRMGDTDNDDIRTGAIYAQVLVIDIKRNITKRFPDKDIIQAVIESCEANMGYKFAGSK